MSEKVIDFRSLFSNNGVTHSQGFPAHPVTTIPTPSLQQYPQKSNFNPSFQPTQTFYPGQPQSFTPSPYQSSVYPGQPPAPLFNTTYQQQFTPPQQPPAFPSQSPTFSGSNAFADTLRQTVLGNIIKQSSDNVETASNKDADVSPPTKEIDDQPVAPLKIKSILNEKSSAQILEEEEKRRKLEDERRVRDMIPKQVRQYMSRKEIDDNINDLKMRIEALELNLSGFSMIKNKTETMFSMLGLEEGDIVSK